MSSQVQPIGSARHAPVRRETPLPATLGGAGITPWGPPLGDGRGLGQPRAVPSHRGMLRDYAPRTAVLAALATTCTRRPIALIPAGAIPGRRSGTGNSGA